MEERENEALIESLINHSNFILELGIAFPYLQQAIHKGFEIRTSPSPLVEQGGASLFF
jgi:hypothetical protein